MIGIGMVRRAIGQRRPHVEIDNEEQRELLEGRVDDYKEDVYVAEGDGEVFPSLPVTTPEELYGEFEADSEAPVDVAR